MPAESTAIVAPADEQQISRIVKGDASFETLRKVAAMFASSGMFKRAGDLEASIAAAGVKILAGAELGFGPFQSMSNIHFFEVKGRPQLQIGASLLAAMIRRGGYEYSITEHTDLVCTIEFSRQGRVIGESKFTMVDALKAGLSGKDVWKRNPRNMLFARAISNGAKWHCPDVLGGAVYTEGDDFIEETDFVPIGQSTAAPVTPQAIEEPDPISTRDAKKIFETARDEKNGARKLSNDEIKSVLQDFGYADTASILKSHYEPIIVAIQSAKNIAPDVNKKETEANILKRMREAISKYEAKLGTKIFAAILGAHGFENVHLIDALKPAQNIATELEAAYELVIKETDGPRKEQAA